MNENPYAPAASENAPRSMRLKWIVAGLAWLALLPFLFYGCWKVNNWMYDWQHPEVRQWSETPRPN